MGRDREVLLRNVWKPFFPGVQVAKSVGRDSEGVQVDREAVIFESWLFLHLIWYEPFGSSKSSHLEIFSAFQVKRYAKVCNNELEGVVASYEDIVRFQVSVQYLERVQHENTLNDLGKAISNLDLSEVPFVLGSLLNKVLEIAEVELSDGVDLIVEPEVVVEVRGLKQNTRTCQAFTLVEPLSLPAVFRGVPREGGFGTFYGKNPCLA